MKIYSVFFSDLQIKQTKKYYNIQENILFFQNRLKIYRGKKEKKNTCKDVREIFIEPYKICLGFCCCQCSTVFYSFSGRTGRISHFLSSSRASNCKLPTHVSSHLASLFLPSMFLSLDENKGKNTTAKGLEISQGIYLYNVVKGIPSAWYAET